MGKYGAPPAPYTSSDKTRKENKNNIAKKNLRKTLVFDYNALKSCMYHANSWIEKGTPPNTTFLGTQAVLENAKEIPLCAWDGLFMSHHPPTCSSSFVVKTATHSHFPPHPPRA